MMLMQCFCVFFLCFFFLSYFLYKNICCGYSFEFHRHVFFFPDFIFKSICCGYSFELPQLVKAIQMSTHIICLDKIILAVI